MITPDMNETLVEAARVLGYSAEQVIKEKIEELRARSILACVPNRKLSQSEYRDFVQVATTSQPGWLLEATTAEFDGRTTVDRSTKLLLEDRQRWRCGLCGLQLSRQVEPHVDHIRPISLGGANSLDNLQLLCRDCNLGKSNITNWVLAMPYSDTSAVITVRKRFCVLKRDDARCTECGEGPPGTQLGVALKISQSQGGRYIVDNLQTLCIEHLTARNKALLRRGRAKFSRRRTDIAFGSRSSGVSYSRRDLV